MSDYHYDASICRNIAVDARFVLFVIDKFAGCTRLIDEMTLIDESWTKTSAMEKSQKRIDIISKKIEGSEAKPELFMERASLYAELGKPEMALKDYNAVLAMNKANASANLGKATALAALGKTKESNAYFDLASKMDSKNPEVYFQEGLALADAKNYKSALVSFDKAVALDRNHTKAWYNRGMCLFYMGREEEGCSDIHFSEQLGGEVDSYIYRTLCKE